MMKKNISVLLNKISDVERSMSIFTSESPNVEANFNAEMLKLKALKNKIITNICAYNKNDVLYDMFESNNYIPFINEIGNRYSSGKSRGKKVKSGDSLITYSKKLINIDICGTCGIRMIMSTNRFNELTCEKCGRIEQIHGLTDSLNNYSTLADSSKLGKSSDSCKRFVHWLGELDGNSEIPKAFLKRVKKNVNDRFNDPKAVRCDDIYSVLKMMGESQYNDKIPTIMKHITGKPPPKLSDSEKDLLTHKFRVIMYCYYTVINNLGCGKKNKSYNPYFIRRLLEKQFSKTDEKYKLLKYIHIQGFTTNQKNDIIWNGICKILNW